MLHLYSLQSISPVLLSPGEGMPENTLSGQPEPVWVNLVHPTHDECAAVSERYAIPKGYLEAAFDANERPRVEKNGACFLILTRVPFRHDPARRVSHSTCPIATIVTRDALVTVCLKDKIVHNLLSGDILGSGAHITVRLALTLLLRASSGFITQLHVMDEEVGAMERALKESMRNQVLIKMLHLEKSLIYFQTALKANHSVMEKLQSATSLATTPEDAMLLDDVLIENKQATDMAEIYTQIMGSLSNAFGAIVSNNLNKVMRVLAGLAVVFMVPTIIGALYGMNVPLPFADSPYAFAGLCIAGLGISFAVFHLLKKKGWM